MHRIQVGFRFWLFFLNKFSITTIAGIPSAVHLAIVVATIFMSIVLMAMALLFL